MDVKPWEPVTYQWAVISGEEMKKSLIWPFDSKAEEEGISVKDEAHVTLANGQRIIVRALSDERKAARAHERAKAWIASLPDNIIRDSIR